MLLKKEESKMYICPVCRNKLNKDTKKSAYGSLVCEKNHSFDYAKQGYVNLLTADKMHSKNPGDNKLMVEARESFLKKDYYKPFCDALKEEAEKTSPKNILDAGCGEGYYTASLYAEKRNIYGVDISKNAIISAAKKNKSINYSVASLFSLPFYDESFDMLISLFAPYAHDEFIRVLKKGGIMILGIPDENHLFEIKELLYDEPYKNEVKDFHLDDFEFLYNRDIKFKMNLSDNTGIQNLFMMTPYYYRTPKEKTEKLKALEKLTISAEFKLLVYRK